MVQVDFYLSFSQIDVEIRNDIDRNTKKSHLCLHRLPINAKICLKNRSCPPCFICLDQLTIILQYKGTHDLCPINL